ncbi:MAG: homocysteine biosynthesis protein [Candidatus Nezhaarchaeota archaeon]|nr:homocysteine biosynthesis protein [Candidatus Nezhaarchaeota archaeon]
MSSEPRGAEVLRSYEEINEKIRKGDAVVMTADEYVEYAKRYGVEKAAEEVDVVTTGTFGAMCSSGAFLNFGHADPPIKMFKCWLNNVPTYKGLAAVDAYIGATAISEDRGIEYGGGHVIEDIVSRREVELRAEGYVTDCYPRRFIETTITIDDLNQAVLVNPRNAYQRYVAATNSTDRVLYTYMGTLLPGHGNVMFSGSGQLSPLYKDRGLEVIGIGTRIFLGGGVGYVIGEGTQNKPQDFLATLMVKGDLKQMSPDFLRGATIHRYGCTLYVGLGIPIPVINLRVAKTAATSDEEIYTELIDYGVPSRNRPVLRKVSYAELKSGRVRIGDREVPASSMSSLFKARKVAEELKKWIAEGRFTLTRPVELLPTYREFKGLEAKRYEPKVRDAMSTKVVKASPDDDIKTVAKLMVNYGIDHVTIVSREGKLVGIVTSWDLARALANDKRSLREVMTTQVIVARPDESLHVAVSRLEKYGISGMPVVDEDWRVVGIVTSDDVARMWRSKVS